MSTVPGFRRGVLWLCGISLATLGFAYWTLTATAWGGDQGITYAPNGISRTVMLVTAATGPAAEAGVKSGDRIDVRELPGFTIGSVNNAPTRFHILRAGRYLPITLHPSSAGPDGAWLVRLFSDIWTLLFAALIAWRARAVRGSILLALVLAVQVLGDALHAAVLPWAPATAAMHFAGLAAIPLRYALLVRYFAGFGSPTVGVRAVWTRIVYGLCVVIFIAQSAYDASMFAHAVDLRHLRFVYFLLEVALTAPTIPVLICGILAAKGTQGADAQRVRAVVAAYTVLWVPWLLAGPFAPLVGPRADVLLWHAHNSVHALVPVILGYAALRRRLFDVGFVLNRAAIFTIISALVVGAFVVLEWALGKWFENAGRAAGLELNAALALVLGLSLRFVHTRVDSFVDTVFFRKRHEDGRALLRFAHEAAFVTQRDLLLIRTRDVIETHLGVESAAVVPLGELDLNDPAVLAMRTWREPVELARFSSSLRGEYAFPMVAHGELQGAIVCGEKQNGEAYAPDEVEVMKDVAHGVGVAIWSLDLLNVRDGVMHGALREMLAAQHEMISELRSFASRLPVLDSRTPP